jgi:hypothetical protein
MATLEEVANHLESLSPESLEELALFVRYLRWKQSPTPTEMSGRLWDFDFVEHFRRASVTGDQDPSGMEVQIGEAACDSEWRMALWQHPPVQGSATVEYQVPIPPEVRNLHLRFATGIRDGSQLAAGNVVAFRVFVNNWRIWSDTQDARRWNAREIIMPALPGDVARIQFVTDGLGNHEWAWAAWGEPRLSGEIVEPQ